MKLLCLNVAIFEKNNQKIKDFLQEQNGDILCFQEVTRRADQDAFEDLISLDAIDSASLNLQYSYFSLVKVFKDFKKENFHGKEKFEADFGGFVESGEYLKSKYKIIKAQTVFVQQNADQVMDWSNWPEQDSKAFAVVDLQIKEKKLRVINYHGVWTKEKVGNELTQSAVQKIYERAKEVDYPVIICGDFNLFPDSESMKILNENFVSLVDQFNVKTTRPSTNELSSLQRNVVDFIFVTPDIKVNKFEVLDSDVSDHLPLVLDFSL